MGDRIVQIDDYSKASYYVEPHFNDTKLSSATCFFLRNEGDIFLITNWHVVTGKNPNTGMCLRSDGAIPNNLVISLFDEKSEYAKWIEYRVELYDANGDKIWHEHPSYKEKIDAVAIKINIPSDNYLVFPVNELEEPFNETTVANVSDDVFVLGFPFGIKAGGNLPIWKRASLASEPDVNMDDLPKIFIDTASRSGMSGSPVIYKQRRPVTVLDQAEQKISRYFTKFIGVYSGRIGTDDELKAQLGIVWKASAISEIIASV